MRKKIGAHRYLKDLLGVVQHLDPDGHLAARGWSPWGLQARLQGGHTVALWGAEPLAGSGRPVGRLHHGDQSVEGGELSGGVSSGRVWKKKYKDGNV